MDNACFDFKKLHDELIASGNVILPEIESKQIVSHYAIPTPKGKFITTIAQLKEASTSLAFPVVCKVSGRLLHKTEIGGVITGIKSYDELKECFSMLDSSMKQKNIAGYNGILVEEQCHGHIEMIAGYTNDPVFGPTVMLGSGGIYTDLFKDVVFHHAPVTEEDVVSMLSRLRCYPLLLGYRNIPTIDCKPLIQCFMNLNRLICDGARYIQSIDCNPIIVDEKSCVVADASFTFYHSPIPDPFIVEKPAVQHLHTFFNPASVAVVGASTVANKIGNVIVDTLINGGFHGDIYPINPHQKEVLGLTAHHSINELAKSPDVVIIAVDLQMVPEILDQMHAKGCHNAIIISGGGKELGGTREKLEKEIEAKAKCYDIRIIGPNCIGVFNSLSRFDSFFYHRDRFTRPPQGTISFITQSGTWGVTFMELAQTTGLHTMVSYGNRVDVDEADLISYLMDDAGTGVIGSYIEGLQKGKKYAEAIAHAIKKHKPVVVYKTGRSDISSRAAISHTGAYGGSYTLYHDLLQDAGAILTDSLHECFAACMALSMQPPAKGNRVALVSNGAGPMVNALDLFPQKNLVLAPLSNATKKTMRDHFSFFYIVHNPVDVTGSATSDDYDFVLQQLMNDDGVDIIMPFFVFQNTPLDETIIEKMKKYSDLQKKPIICCCTEGKYSQHMKERLIHADIPVFKEISHWVVAVYALMQWGKIIQHEV
ncbi:MAG: acetate--CoA ligase family protein [Spirochaetes bacterium]|nr:acetate--CoA ligase family protein [Spirochaetota bacterium]